MKGIKIAMISVAVLLLVSSVHMVFCQTKPPSGMEPKYGGTCVMSVSYDPGHFNPGITTRLGADSGGGPVFEALVYESTEPGFMVKPNLAESWETTDSKTWTFHLVRNATWHDGEKFTSADVKFTVENVVIPFNPGGSIVFGDLASIELPGDYTVVFKFNEPNAAFPIFLGAMWVPILPKHLYEGTDILENKWNQKPVGTGPFKFSEYKSGEYLKLVKNENYWKKGLPYLDEVILRVIPDSTMRVIAFERGEVHYIPAFFVSFVDIDRLRGVPGVTVVEGVWNQHNVEWLWTFGWKDTPVKNKIVRQAIAQAINTATISELVFYGINQPAKSVFHSMSWWFDPDSPQYPYSPSKAEQLLDSAGYPRVGADNMRFSLSFGAATKPEEVKAAELIRDFLQDIGIKVNLEFLDIGAFHDAVAIGTYDLALVQGSTLGPDPMISAKFFTSSGIHDPPVPITNVVRYSNSRVDELFDLSMKVTDIEQRKAYFAEIQQIVLDDLPYIPIVEYGNPQLASSEFINLPPCASGPRAGWEYVWWTQAGVAKDSSMIPLETLYIIIAAISIVAIAIIVGVYILMKRKTA